MYSELIYTRCRQGVDLLKEGRPITSDGFKVYSCSSSILEDGKNDLPFLLNAAQAKQPYNDPSFMDDAYSYLVPEKGDSFMIDFYPVPYDPNAKGDYSHRAGNFLNHILLGDYTGFYPSELFRDDSVWYAKTRGEAYYYENALTKLPPRSDISAPVGQFSLEEIGAFISDGRKEALMSAVSFLITQYELPPENRKFLVIRDETSEKIEMWIAAIEHAFSPRMAAAIPFATRMDKFTTLNRYTVNQSGVYQTQINLQDRNQKLRYRAMIVGVDERDRTNAAAARPLASSPFVLLDGKEKKATFEAETSNSYFRFITSFTDAHQSFCREFLQTINITAPSPDIYELHNVFMVFEGAILPNAKSMKEITAVFGKYSLFNSSKLKSIYDRVTAELPRFLQEDLRSALQIIKWLKAVSRVVGDTNANTHLLGIVCEAFTNQVYKKLDADGTVDFWQYIKNSEFATGVATHFVDPLTIQNNQTYRSHFKSADVVAFTRIYFDCTSCLDSVAVKKQELLDILNWGMNYCYEKSDCDSAWEIFSSLAQSKRNNMQEMIFAIAGSAERAYTDFIMKLLVDYDESILASDSAMMTFVKKLNSEGLGRLVVSVLKLRIRSLSRAAEVGQFIELIEKIPALGSKDITELYEALDKRLVITDKGSLSVALIIQKNRPQGAVCENSAHLYALEVLSNKQDRAQFTRIYNKLIEQQGFPSLDNHDYIHALTDRLFTAQMSDKELGFIVKLFSRVPSYITELVRTLLSMTTQRKNDEWNTLISVAAETRDRATYDTILNECVKLKQGEKALAQLFDMLVSNESRAYFHPLAERAKEVIRANKPQAGFGWFGGRK